METKDNIRKRLMDLKLQNGEDNKNEIQKLQQALDMKALKEFINSGQIQKVQSLSDLTLLHDLTTDVIIYEGGHYVEMLKNGKFLYRPSGIGQGKRSLSLWLVEEFMFKDINK
tara:strand:- start:2040 stop:2378 length:339 start_codon:yes stop_codon:yes gene_type:complete